MQSRARQASQLISNDNQAHSAFTLHQNPWSPIQLYSIYRLILVGVLQLLTLTANMPMQLGSYDASLFEWVLNSFTVIAVIAIFNAHFRWPSYNVQIFMHPVLDISFLLGLIFSSGGLHSGMGILLGLPIILQNILKPGQVSLMISAISITALLGIEFYMQQEAQRSASDLSYAGILTLFIFSASWMLGKWFEKASITAELAKRRGVDLANLSQLNQSILDQLQTGILVVERTGVIRHMNPTAWDMLGRPADWRSKPLRDFAPELNAHYKHWVANVCPKVVSYDIKHWKTTELSFRLAQLGTRSSGASLIYLEDTSAQREKQQGVKMASLGQLTANIAHEIRNPLGAISHAAQLLSESPELTKPDQRMVQIIQENSKRMNTTIESVLNLSRKREASRENIALGQWLQKFREDFVRRSSLTMRQVNLHVEPLDAEIQFDPNHFDQIMWNLCRNAEKYAHEDSEELQLDIQCSQPAHTRDLILSVIDNGVGITEVARERLFEPFYTTSTKGTGLGLFMARELCLSNGANLEYVQLNGRGSCFRIVFAHSKHN
ncbi:two-component system sensor histidine kinase NtrB [Leucothrix mucor]|uniref:two-component system sensor histidine kinase NtrB n=1 Tax=Leucothrix mucor TaxID=45248 RepID=UPI0003B54E47|nr:ATP-binding protein [Leucothrix mucor]